MADTWDGAVGTASYVKVLKRAQKHAEETGYSLNPDEDRVRKVIGLMTMNLEAFGEHYCPCKQSHPLNTETDVICPCPELQSEVEKDGSCFCRLFFG